LQLGAEDICGHKEEDNGVVVFVTPSVSRRIPWGSF